MFNCWVFGSANSVTRPDRDNQYNMRIVYWIQNAHLQHTWISWKVLFVAQQAFLKDKACSLVWYFKARNWQWNQWWISHGKMSPNTERFQFKLEDSVLKIFKQNFGFEIKYKWVFVCLQQGTAPQTKIEHNLQIINTSKIYIYIRILKQIVWETKKWHYIFLHAKRLLSYWSKHYFSCFEHISRTAEPPEILMPFLSFSKDFFQVCHIIINMLNFGLGAVPPYQYHIFSVL